MLADDVGFGKTTVAAIVAWVVAGKNASVRILAPNKVMQRRWAEELEYHIAPLNACAPHLDASKNRIRSGDVRRLRAGSIHVATHRYAAQDRFIGCDLLIIDEAHRAKGDATQFAQALRAQGLHARRVLILTATPMSIDLSDLDRMLQLVGADDALAPLREYAAALRRFYRTARGGSNDEWIGRLVTHAQAAICSLGPYVIRHSLSDLGRERESFGELAEWSLPIRGVNEDELELLMRADRVLRLRARDSDERAAQTNDARFHVGYRQLRIALNGTHEWLRDAEAPSAPLIKKHLRAIESLLQQFSLHPKVDGVARAAQEVVAGGEKVLVFCHHHATAQEIAIELRSRLKQEPARERAHEKTWLDAWNRVLQPDAEHPASDYDALRDVMIRWFSQPALRAQVGAWLTDTVDLTRPGMLFRALQESSVPGDRRTTVADAANALFARLVEHTSESTLGVLRTAKQTGSSSLLGGNDDEPLIAICEAPSKVAERRGFLSYQEPDTAIAIFNSPFGARVLVATDKLSEGIDLHRYCRHLIHFELSPSPIRTIQRNGRVRRVNSWSSVTGKPLRIAYPAFRGTRDERLVSIMKQRLDAFAILLGGTPDIQLDDTDEVDESWRSEVLERVRARLERLNGRLAVSSR